MTLASIGTDISGTATACAIVGSVFDVKSRRVPKRCHLSRVPDWTISASRVGRMEADAQCAGRGSDMRLVFLVFYLAGGMGAGDVKLIMAWDASPACRTFFTTGVDGDRRVELRRLGLALVRESCKRR